MKFLFNKNRNNFVVIVLVFFLFACSSDGERPEYRERTLAAIYNNAVYHLENGRYQAAAYEFDEVERQHPYSPWARRSMLMSAYTYYCCFRLYTKRS